MRRLAITVAALVTLAACGGGSDDSGSPDDSDTAEITATSEPAVTAPAQTTPPQTEPPQTEPEQTTPPQTEPPATEPVDTEPPEPAAPESEFSTVAALVAADRPVNLAHAGGDQVAPHSTMFAFREGLAAGADALEMDVLLTSDGVLIVQHDDTVDKTTNVTGPVGELTLEEIQALDNAYWFSPQCWPCQDRPLEEYVYRGVRTGEVTPPEGYSADDFRVETFQSVAEAFPDHVLNVEIKGTFADAIPVVEQLATEIDELDLTERIVVVSFDDQLLDAFHELAPDVALSPGLTRLTDWFLNGAEIEPYFAVLQVPPFQGDIEVINADTVQRIHDEGRVVWAWADDASTQENTEFYSQLLEYGVDGIITGRPAAMVEALTS
jgi:glycerophosphoryl diester phosphodiesterase